MDNPHFIRERKMLSKQILYFANVSLDLNVIFFASGLKVVLPFSTFHIFFYIFLPFSYFFFIRILS